MAVKRRAFPSANRPPPAGNPNFLLAALPAADYKRVVSTLEVVPLKLKDILHKPGEPIRDVYFPGGGFCSILTVLEDGRMVEVATIGREGMVGTSVMLDGASPVPSAAMVQAETNTCYRMKAAELRREIDRRGAFFDLLARYSQALVGFIMQSTACNAVHSVEQRLARWLLMASDRVGRNDFPLTQEFVARQPVGFTTAGRLILGRSREAWLQGDQIQAQRRQQREEGRCCDRTPDDEGRIPESCDQGWTR